MLKPVHTKVTLGVFFFLFLFVFFFVFVQTGAAYFSPILTPKARFAFEVEKPVKTEPCPKHRSQNAHEQLRATIPCKIATFRPIHTGDEWAFLPN